MSFRTPLDCSSNSTEGLEKLVSDDLATSFNEVSNEITAAEDLINSLGLDGLLDNCNNALQNIVNLGDPYSTVTDIDELPSMFGIDTPNTQEDDERRIFDSTDIVLTNGIFFKKPSSDNVIQDNIEVLRRAYFSVGRDLSKLNSEYADLIDNAYRFRLEVGKAQPLVPNQDLTLAQIRTIFNDNSISKADYVVLSDKSVLLVKRTPLLVPNINKEELQVRYSTSPEVVTSSILHKTEPKNTTNAINRWVNLGYDIELPSILDGQDPAMSTDVLEPIMALLKERTSRLISDVNFYLSRLNTVNSSIINEALSRTIDEMDVYVKNLVSIFQFEVSQITEFDTLSKLRQKLTDDEIHYLFNTQRYVKAIDLNATEDEVFAAIRTSTNISSGETTISTNIINQNKSLKETNYSVVLFMVSDIQNIKEALASGVSFESLNKILASATVLSERILTDSVTPQQTLSGYPSYTSPNAIIAQRMNFNRNFKLTLSLGFVDDAIAKISALYDKYVGQTISALFGIIANLAKKAITMVNQLRDKLLAQIMPLKRKLDQFISKYLTLIGSGDFNSSILKCAVNFNIGLDTDVLDILAALIEQLAQVLNNLVSTLVALLVKAIEKILCPVISMIDQFIGAGNSYLPSFCSFNSPILLPEEAVKSLNDLRSIASLQNTVINTYSGDLIRVRALVETAPDRLSSFVDQAGCLNKNASTLMSNTLINAYKNVSVPSIGF